MATNVTAISQFVRGLSQGRPLGVFSVAEFGAKADGVSNDSPAIQAAIDAANAQNGGIVYFPAGAYGIGTTIDWRKPGVWLVGASRRSVELHAIAALSVMIDGNFTAPENFYAGMVNLAIKGRNGPTDPQATACLELRLCNRVHFTGCIFTEASGTAVKLDGVIWALFDDCNFNSSSIGVELVQTNSEDIPSNADTFRSCRFENNTLLAIRGVGTTGTIGITLLVVESSSFEFNGATGNSSAGAIFLTFVRCFTIARCYFEGTSGGATIRLGENAIEGQITGNYFGEQGSQILTAVVWVEKGIGTSLVGNNFDGDEVHLIQSDATAFLTYTGPNFIGNSNADVVDDSHRITVTGAPAKVVSAMGATFLIMDSASAVDIMNLSEGVPGQRVTLIFSDKYTTLLDISNGGNFRLAGGVNFTGNSQWDTLTVIQQGGTWTEVSRSHNRGPQTAPPGDTTPSVAGFDYLVFANSSPTTVTTLDDGSPGQRVTLIFTTATPNTTLKDSATGGSFQLAGGVNFVSTGDDTLTVIRYGTTWYEVSRSVN